MVFNLGHPFLLASRGNNYPSFLPRSYISWSSIRLCPDTNVGKKKKIKKIWQMLFVLGFALFLTPPQPVVRYTETDAAELFNSKNPPTQRSPGNVARTGVSSPKLTGTARSHPCSECPGKAELWASASLGERMGNSCCVWSEVYNLFSIHRNPA